MYDSDRQWLKAGVEARRRANAVRAPVRKAVKEATAQGLVGVRFASGKALDTAKEMGLTWPVFEGKKASSARGFTVADVRQIAVEG